MDYDPKVDLVSHSEVDSFSRCEMQHYFGNVLNLSPEVPGKPLRVGVFGHKVLEVFYNAIKEGVDPVPKVEEFIVQAFMFGHADFETLEKVQSVMRIYMDWYCSEPFEVVKVESYEVYEQKDNPSLHFLPDLLVRGTRGKYKDELIIIDHKWLSSFHNAWSIQLNAQLPKYLYAFNKSHPELAGHEVKYVMLNQIRTTTKKDPSPEDLFCRETWEPTEAFQANVLNEHNKHAREIVRRRKMSVQAQKVLAARTLMKDVCAFCDFNQLCTKELNGEDFTREMTANYKPRDLTYREDRKRPTSLDYLWNQKT